MSQDLFSDEEMRLLNKWLDSLTWKNDIALASDGGNAAADLLLNGIQGRLPQWAVIHADGTIDFSRKTVPKRSRKINLYPQLLFEIDWGGGPGSSYPDNYHVVFLPLFEIHVVTASTDEESSAIGAFRGNDISKDAVGIIVREHWEKVYNQGGHQDPWETFVNKGLVESWEAGSWCSDVFGEREYEFEAVWVESDSDASIGRNDVKAISPFEFPDDKTVDTLTCIERIGLRNWLENTFDTHRVDVRFGWFRESPDEQEPEDHYFYLYWPRDQIGASREQYFYGPDFPTVSSAFGRFFLELLRNQSVQEFLDAHLDKITKDDILNQIISQCEDRKKSLIQEKEEARARIEQLLRDLKRCKPGDTLYMMYPLPRISGTRNSDSKVAKYADDDSRKQCKFWKWQPRKKVLWVTVPWKTTSYHDGMNFIRLELRDIHRLQLSRTGHDMQQ